MSARKDGETKPTKNRTTVEPKAEREIVVTRTFDAPARIVFQAWTTPELFKRCGCRNRCRCPLAIARASSECRACARLPETI